MNRSASHASSSIATALRRRITRLTVGLAVAALLGAAWAQTTGALTFDAALAAADTRTNVVNAQLAADDAARSLARTDADPLALRLDEVQARQAAALADRELVVAVYEAYSEIGSAFTQAAAADLQLGLAEAGRDLAARSAEIARIRVERGSATELDVRTAENDLADAETSVTAARQGRALAYASLGSLIGVDVTEVAPLDDALVDPALADLPSDDELTEAVAQSPTLLQAEQGLELARVGRDLLDPSYASQVQIDQADLRVEQAQTGLREARRGLTLQARSLLNRVESARDTLGVARDAARIAAERTDLERQRLEAGLIADLVFQQSELQQRQAELGLVQARHDLLLALLDFQAGTGIGLEGLDGF